MKKTLFLLAIGLIIYSCKNKDEDPQPTKPHTVQWYDTLEWCTPAPPDGYIAFCTMESTEITPYSVDYATGIKKDPLTIYNACDYYYIFVPGIIDGDSISMSFYKNDILTQFPKIPNSKPYLLSRSYNSAF